MLLRVRARCDDARACVGRGSARVVPFRPRATTYDRSMMNLESNLATQPGHCMILIQPLIYVPAQYPLSTLGISQ